MRCPCASYPMRALPPCRASLQRGRGSSAGLNLHYLQPIFAAWAKKSEPLSGLPVAAARAAARPLDGLARRGRPSFGACFEGDQPIGRRRQSGGRHSRLGDLHGATNLILRPQICGMADLGLCRLVHSCDLAAFDSEAAMSEALDAVFEELRHAGPPEMVREIIAMRIITAIRLGERDPARLLEAALRRPRES